MEAGFHDHGQFKPNIQVNSGSILNRELYVHRPIRVVLVKLLENQACNN